jgi:hypothetical protein
MLTIFGRKKLTTERAAHIFCHHIIETVEQGFPEVAGFINDSPELVADPSISTEDSGRFLMIVIAGNFSHLPQYFTEDQDKEIIEHSIQKLAQVFDMTPSEFAIKVKEYRDFMNRANSPSKNTIYAMSKGVFYKYNLCDFQDDYFKSMKTANPIFLKNMDEVVRNFLWDWEAFNDKFKVVAQATA